MLRCKIIIIINISNGNQGSVNYFELNSEKLWSASDDQLNGNNNNKQQLELYYIRHIAHFYRKQWPMWFNKHQFGANGFVFPWMEETKPKKIATLIVSIALENKRFPLNHFAYSQAVFVPFLSFHTGMQQSYLYQNHLNFVVWPQKLDHCYACAGVQCTPQHHSHCTVLYCMVWHMMQFNGPTKTEVRPNLFRILSCQFGHWKCFVHTFIKTMFISDRFFVPCAHEKLWHMPFREHFA